MRDLVLLMFIGLCLSAAIRYPFAGLLTWAWFTVMTPHQAAYDVFGLPLNLIIAAVTLSAYFLSSEFTRFRLDAVTGLIILFAGWLTLSQTFSLDPANSSIYFDRFIKTLLFVVLCAQMARDKLRFNALVWLLVIGLGFFAAKGALFTLATFGEFRVQGLPETIIEDNNHFGIAIATILPLILYLRGEALRPWVRHGLLVLFCLAIVAVIGTHSRGGFLCLVAFGGLFWLGSRHKVSILAGLTLLLVPTIAFMPAKWTERMGTIGEATQDASFMGRVDAWIINIKLAAQNPVTGAGLRNSYQEEIAKAVDPMRAESAKAAHSIYFEILGGAGYGGLIIYLLIFTAAYLSAEYVKRSTRYAPAQSWKGNFARYGQMSLVIFAVGGASTSMEMWDGYLVVIALLSALAIMERDTPLEKGYVLAALNNQKQRRAANARRKTARGAAAFSR